MEPKGGNRKGKAPFANIPMYVNDYTNQTESHDADAIPCFYSKTCSYGSDPCVFHRFIQGDLR